MKKIKLKKVNIKKVKINWNLDKLISAINAKLYKKYTKTYHLASHDCDKNGNIRIITLMNLLQDATQHHLERLNYGVAFFMRQQGWIVSRYAIKIKKYPRRNEEITISTWVSDTKRISMVREFAIMNAKKEVLVEAVSKWALIDLVKKKTLEIPFFGIRAKKLFASNFSHPTIRDAKEQNYEFNVCYDNIDFNQHVNNGVYALWASESVEKDFRLHHSPRELIISFSKEAMYGERLSVKTLIDGEELKTSHVISIKGKDHAKVSIWWGKNNMAHTLMP